LFIKYFYMSANFHPEAIMNIEYYRNFVEIVRCGTISAAARKLLIAQPALSAQLKVLERDIGVQLLERTARRVVPTAAGVILYEKAQKILALQSAAEKEIAVSLRGAQGTLWLAMDTGQPDAWALNMLSGFRQAHPDIVFELFETPAERMLDALRDGVAELGLTRDFGESHPALEILSAAETRLFAVFRRGNPWLSSAIREVPLRLLRGAPLSLPRALRPAVEAACGALGFDADIVFSVESRAAALSWAERGETVAIVAASHTGPRDDRDVCLRPLSLPADRQRSALVHLEGHPLSRVARMWVEYCANHNNIISNMDIPS
jgi:DNA-binding transcriptional LysR family regulator